MQAGLPPGSLVSQRYYYPSLGSFSRENPLKVSLNVYHHLMQSGSCPATAKIELVGRWYTL
jgi:hypothetical protein